MGRPLAHRLGEKTSPNPPITWTPNPSNISNMQLYCTVFWFQQAPSSQVWNGATLTLHCTSANKYFTCLKRHVYCANINVSSNSKDVACQHSYSAVSRDVWCFNPHYSGWLIVLFTLQIKRLIKGDETPNFFTTFGGIKFKVSMHFMANPSSFRGWIWHISNNMVALVVSK